MCGVGLTGSEDLRSSRGCSGWNCSCRSLVTIGHLETNILQQQPGMCGLCWRTDSGPSHEKRQYSWVMLCSVWGCDTLRFLVLRGAWVLPNECIRRVLVRCVQDAYNMRELLQLERLNLKTGYGKFVMGSFVSTRALLLLLLTVLPPPPPDGGGWGSAPHRMLSQQLARALSLSLSLSLYSRVNDILNCMGAFPFCCYSEAQAYCAISRDVKTRLGGSWRL